MNAIEGQKRLDNLFGNRFYKERALKNYQGFAQGTWVEVDLTSLKTRKYQGVDELLVVAFLPETNSFIGMTGSGSLLQVPLNIIVK